MSRLAIALLLVGSVAVAQDEKKEKEKPKPKAVVAFDTQRLEGIKAIKYFYGNAEHPKAERFSYVMVWADIREPEPMSYLARSLEAMGRIEEAHAWFTTLDRVLANFAKGDELTKFGPMSQRGRKRTAKPWEDQRAQWEKAAAGRKFESVEKVDDLWMSRVECDLDSLRQLEGWWLVGGRKDGTVPGDWVHNKQCFYHPSGMKRMIKAEGRTGVLFARPSPANSQLSIVRGHPTRITIANTGKAALLRVGTRGWNSAYLLRVGVGDEDLFSQRIPMQDWQDLKIDLGKHAGKDVTVRLDLVDAGNSEGAWFDYIDFFAN